MEKKYDVICFDLDDTLIDDSYKFETIFCDCIKTIITALENRTPQIDTILHTARELDNEFLKTWPLEERYLPKRVATAWKETYIKMSDAAKVPVKKAYSKITLCTGNDNLRSALLCNSRCN